MLNQIIVKGDFLLIAKVEYEDGLLSLPAEAFDGYTFLPTSRALEQEWQESLQKPIKRETKGNHLFIELANRRIERHQICIARLDLIISSTKERLQKIQNTIRIEPNRSRAIYHLETTLNRYQKTWLSNRLA